MSGRRRGTPELFGLAGAVERRRSRASGTTITLYDALEAGLESDPETPWATVCEEHGSIVCHGTRSAARASMALPDWCEDCQRAMDAKQPRHPDLDTPEKLRTTFGEGSSLSDAVRSLGPRHEDCDCPSCLPPSF